MWLPVYQLQYYEIHKFASTTRKIDWGSLWVVTRQESCDLWSIYWLTTDSWYSRFASVIRHQHQLSQEPGWVVSGSGPPSKMSKMASDIYLRYWEIVDCKLKHSHCKKGHLTPYLSRIVPNDLYEYVYVTAKNTPQYLKVPITKQTFQIGRTLAITYQQSMLSAVGGRPKKTHVTLSLSWSDQPDHVLQQMLHK